MVQKIRLVGIYRSWVVFVICLLAVQGLWGQQYIIGMPEEDSILREQLAGNYNPLVSMAVRPLEEAVSNKKTFFRALPLSMFARLNTRRPFGWNDGSMIPANGFQLQVRAGVYVRWGLLEAQLAPEWVYAANSAYDTSVRWGSNAGGVYRRLFPGQSCVGLRLGPVSVGFSTQNLWWGPGIRSSLLMSNNAPGFLHAYIRSNRPVKTAIGHFEWQLIGSRLESEADRPYENMHIKRTAEIYPADWRYQSAFVFSYQPRWVPGLFLGMTRTLQRYQQDIGLGGGGFLQQYIPVLTKAFQKKNAQNDDAENTDQLASFFFRWLLPKSGVEVYGEWGYNDYKQNIRDYIMDATHSAAYIVGIQKLIKKPRFQLLIGAEITKTAESASNLLRGAGNWYVHGGDNGYTHNNQILGVGAGFGSNLQSFRLHYLPEGEKGYPVQFQFDRIVRDPNSFSTRWVDYSWQVQSRWRKNHWTLLPRLGLVYARNNLWVEGNQSWNWQVELRSTYGF